MIKAGIVDPVLVTKTALKNAVSVATTITFADCIVSNIRINPYESQLSYYIVVKNIKEKPKKDCWSRYHG